MEKPEKWIEMLRLYRGVLTPDFSIYIEMPEAVICYSEPFPEMEGSIIYVDDERSSWKHMEDDVVPAESIKHTHGILTLPQKRDIITKNGYVCKGGGSAGGGKWIPKNKDAERFKGQPNTIKVTRDKHGVKRETVIGKSGLAIRERHHTNHNRPDKHSEPHDHVITWDNLDEHPEPGPPINYSEENIHSDMTSSGSAYLAAD